MRELNTADLYKTQEGSVEGKIGRKKKTTDTDVNIETRRMSKLDIDEPTYSNLEHFSIIRTRFGFFFYTPGGGGGTCNGAIVSLVPVHFQ